MLISDYLDKDCITVALQAKSKEDLINQLAELQFRRHPELSSAEALSELFEREKVLSTGIGKGIAIPHARLQSCQRISVSFGLVQNDLDYASLDGQPVRIVLLIFFPKQEVNLQLRFLARASRLLQQETLRRDLIDCSTPEAVIAAFKRYEAVHFH